MGKKSKRRPRKTAKPETINIDLDDDQMQAAQKAIDADGIAVFAIRDTKGTTAACTTSTVHR
jgi:hypothetical protein